MAGATGGGKALSCFLAIAGTFAGDRAQAELIGIWDVVAPVSAHLVSGEDGEFFDWLNVVNASVTIEEAFTGHSILDDGYANFSTDTIVELNYDEGVLFNATGNDLVVFDAHFEANAYAIATSFDDFLTELTVSANTFLYEPRFYYFGGLPDPFKVEIWGAAFDLSALGVPEGAPVNAIRVRGVTENGGDLLGVGAIREVGEPSAVLVVVTGLILAVRRRHRSSLIRPSAMPNRR